MADLRILIRFIRPGGSANSDDKVVITRLGPNQFNLSYTYGDVKSKTPHNLVLTDRAVFRWMRTTIGILEKDADPFSMVQLDTPFMPSVVFDAGKLGDAYHSLLNALEFHLDNWPVPPVLEDYEDEDEDEEEEEGYEDMPSLVNIAHSQRGHQHLFLDEWEG